MRLFSGLPIGLILLSLGQAHAAVRQYNAELEKSAWELAAQSKLQCTLSHSIPRYGNATFTTQASREQNLTFELDMLSMPANYDVASVDSIAPNWRPGVPSKKIADMTLLKQFNGELPQQAAWTMLTELEKGMSPTIYYADWHNPYDKVAVSLNSINFHKAYDEFLACQSNMLPYSFDDIAFTILNYKLNTAELTKRSKKRLAMIGDYLKADPELDLVLLAGYTDSHGGRYLNQQLSKKRAEAIKSFFAESGVDADRINTDGYGEKRHVATNKNVLGRAKNRRVVIQMERDI